ncbi:tRNA lysidine(34) synthetase TilS [Acidobacteria bacterium AB60]|nr:tRNA lysidine(34) synthetase TilS [Acidobacteria bacterium AB60]
MPDAKQPVLHLDESGLRPGLRLAVGVSGGADSVALIRALAERRRELGLVLSVVHLHHGLRGDEADADLEFVRTLAGDLGLSFQSERVETAASAAADPATGKAAETIEEAARRLRYQWFRRLMAGGAAEAVATAHTRDDQAETVLAKFLRGAWTEGLSGIHPVIEFPEGRILRLLLRTTRAEIEAYLTGLGQGWREDSSNRHLTFTRNRIRHELLPQLESWNPRLREHLAQMAELARDEESWWTEETARAAAPVVLPGRPVRGGGRAAAEGLALDIGRLTGLGPALQRRVLRYAAEQLGFALNFEATEGLRALALSGRASQRIELAGGLRGERTHRELRLSAQSSAAEGGNAAEVTFPVPGEVSAPELGIHLRIEAAVGTTATLRPWRAGDRVHLRHSSGPRKVKEVLERMKVSGTARSAWPVVEMDGRIVWMQGVAVEPGPEAQVTVLPGRAAPG